MYRFLKKIHLWLSIPFGLIISLISATGLILLFQPAPASGAERSRFFLEVMRLHRWLLDAPAVKGGMTPGKMIVGITVIAMVLILISGVMLWWRRSSANLKRNLTIRTGKGLHVFLSDLHTTGGIYSAVFLLIMALTGLTWSFGWYRQPFYALFGIEKGSHIVYAIHAGKFGSLLTESIWFLAALLGATLPLTGYWIFLKSRSKSKHTLK